MIHVVGRGGTEGLGRGKGMTDGLKGECQNHKSNLRVTLGYNKVYLHFHIASATSMFRHFRAASPVHIFHWAIAEGREPGPVYPN